MMKKATVLKAALIGVLGLTSASFVSAEEEPHDPSFWDPCYKPPRPWDPPGSSGGGCGPGLDCCVMFVPDSPIILTVCCPTNDTCSYEQDENGNLRAFCDSAP